MKSEKIEMIDIELIKIPNPRDRNKFTHNEIVSNINTIGLKRPITVRKISEGGYQYALICGQGRLEAYQELKEIKIPSIIKDVNEEVGYIMSLAENIARRKPRSTEMFESVKNLKESGLTDREIGLRLGYTASWVNNITTLLGKGEKKLLAAFESGHIPLYLAVEISRASDEETQELLTEALSKGAIKGAQISIIKNILERRIQGDKGTPNLDYALPRKQKILSVDELSDLYQRNVDEHRKILAKSEFTKENLLLAREIMNQLLQNEDFVSILTKEGLDNIPSIMFNNQKN